MSLQFKASVVICTHNPREHHLSRTFAGLKAQSLSQAEWECIVVDNASTMSLDGRVDLSWHPHARLISEKALGLTLARCRGIAEAAGDVLIFVDDDNVLHPSYLSDALSIAAQYPFLGAWGAGLIVPEFETSPPPWAQPYFEHLALRDVRQVRWSNDVNDWPATPVGAGLCIRRAVAQQYRNEIATDQIGVKLDRKGSSLDGAGDLDLAYTSARFNLGWGVFPKLQLVHLIPKERTSKKYLLQITQASAASLVLLAYKNGRPLPRPQGRLKRSARLLW